ncbi:MAG: S24/S26 family peptidase [Lachnospiraceae bacterium]|jgi:signal peptidase I|nr:S24/S26 family peptidase [Lachnospiraceae bacterium]MCH4031824.1 S24/S26 family peptidase [Lachnospiraceae bacterium]MCH4070448.1 S24/S26 family peptidase [Lachnospiraceae bacterium]MCH4109115.1 S24/S26 family peptidase [Lachnospiraceae bacterium]MCI1302950.1 S24/S26 family peptidase [Lachnospiraceae bacterium]
MQTEKRWISSQILFSEIKMQLAEGRQAAFTVTGMSMWPCLCHGRDQVILEKLKRMPEVGDIVLYKTKEQYLLHRVTKIKNDKFETTGDGNFYHDGWFSNDCIIGRAVALIRNKKKINCDSIRWKVFSRLWILFYPFRRPAFCIWFRIRRYIR